jgi:hypothetical protein
VRWVAAFCGYLCFFTALPAYAFRLVAPKRVTPMRLRIAALLMFIAALILPEVAHYFFASPDDFVRYAPRHIFNPLVTLGDWEAVGIRNQWTVIALGGVGLFACIRLMMMGRRLNAKAPDAVPVPVHAG